LRRSNLLRLPHPQVAVLAHALSTIAYAFVHLASRVGLLLVSARVRQWRWPREGGAARLEVVAVSAMITHAQRW